MAADQHGSSKVKEIKRLKIKYPISLFANIFKLSLNKYTYQLPAMKNFYILLFTILHCSFLSSQIEIQLDQSLICPNFPSEIISGGEYRPGCPATGYIYIPHLADFSSNYSYSIDNGANWQSSPYFGNLSMGNYTCKMKLTIGAQSCIMDYPLNPVKVFYRDYSNQVYIWETDYLERSGKKIIDTVLVTQPVGCTTGRIDVNLLLGGGTYEFSIDGVNFQSSKTFFNVPVGKYQIYVREPGSSCIIGYRYEVSVFPAGYFTFNNIKKKWECDAGTLTFNVSGSGLEYSVNSGSSWQSSPNFNNLAAGYYYPRIRKNGCVYIPPNENLIGLNKYLPQVFEKQFVPGACNGLGQLSFKLYLPLLSSVSASIYLSHDNANYTLLQRNTLSAANINVPVGTNRIYIKIIYGIAPDNGTCVYYFQIAPTIGVLADANITTVNPTCLQNNGSITILPPDNNFTYEYSITNGNSYQSSNVFSNLAPGNYAIKYRNIQLSCFSNTQNVALINENIPPVINTVTVNNISDCGITDGKISINSTPGTGTTLFSINNGSSWQSGNIFSSLPAGNYFVKIKNDNNSCEVIYQNNPVVITAPTPPVFVTVTSTNVSDCNLTDGSISIQATPGSSGIEYSINNGNNWQASNTFSGLDAGSYFVKIRNNNGTCIVSWPSNPVLVTKPSPPGFISVSFTNTTDCSLNNGTITVQASQGSGAIRYSIDNGSSWQNHGNFTGLAPGSYILKLKNDNNTCVVPYAQNPVIISGHTAPIINSVIVDNVTDCGLNDGKLTINATQGEGSVLYSIDNGVTWSSGNVFNNLSAGSYNIKIKNNNGTCVITFTYNPVQITAPLAPQIQQVNKQDVSDCHLNDGSIVIQGTQGSGLPEYSIDGGTNWQTSNSFQDLPPGAYQIAMRNQGGTCRVNYDGNPLNINSPVAPVISSVSFQNVSSCNINDGSITITAIQGSATLQYSIDNGTSWSTTNYFNGLNQGSYFIKVRNSDGTCVVSYINNPVIITAPSAPSITNILVQQPDDCVNSWGSITLEFIPGTGAPQFTINGGQSWSYNNVFTNLLPGTYFTGIRNSDGSCQSISNSPSSIEALDPPEILSVQVSGLIGCTSGLATIFIDAQGSGSMDLLYSIDDGLNWQPNPEFSQLSAGNYYIRVKFSSGVCEVVYNQNPFILNKIPDPIIIEVDKINPLSCEEQLTGTIHITAEDQNLLPISYSINNGNNWQSENSFYNLGPGAYFLAIKNSLGCITMYQNNPLQLNAPAQPIVTDIINITKPDCNAANGSFTVQYYSEANVQFSIDNGMHWFFDPVFTGLSAGNYYVHIRNSDGNCENAYLHNPVVMDEKLGFNIQTITKQDPSECNSNNGELMILVNPPGNYEYSIDGGNQYQDEPSFNNLSAGSYLVSVRLKQSECVLHHDEAIRLNAGNAPEIISVTVHQPDCGMSNGRIEIINQQSNVEFSIDRGLQWQESNVFDFLSEGVYFPALRFKGSNCISYSDSIVLYQEEQYRILSVVSSDNTNCEVPNGSIEITTDIPDAEYSIDGGEQWSLQNSFSGLNAGVYHIIVRKGEGNCELSYSTPIIINSIGGPIINAVSYLNTNNCEHQPSFISIYAEGGEYYSIDGGNSWFIDTIFIDLSPGIYQIAVKKDDCITVGETIQFTVPRAVQLEDLQLKLPSSCSLQDGQIIINGSPADNIMGYRIDFHNSFTNNKNFDSLPAGNYQPQILTIDGCTINFPTIYLYPDGQHFISDVELFQPLDCMHPDGSIIIHPSGKDSTLQYSIDGGDQWQSDTIFNDLVSGDYWILLRTGDTSCIYLLPDKYNLFAKNAPRIIGIDLQNIGDCKDGHTTMTIQASGEHLKFSIDGGMVWKNAFSFFDLADGNYHVQVLDIISFCRSADTTVNINNSIPDLHARYSKKDVSSCSLNDGQIIIDPIDHLEYSIDNGLNWSSDHEFYQLHSGSYQLKVKNLINGCQSETYEIKIGWPGFDPDSVRLEVLDMYCTANGQITILNLPSGYETSLDNENWTDQFQYKNLSADIYRIAVKNKAGCVYNPGFITELRRLDSLPYQVTSLNPPTCTDMENGSIELSLPENISADTKISWNDGKTGNIYQGKDGAHPFTLTYKLCQSEGSVIIPDAEVENFDWTHIKDSVICSGNEVHYTFIDTSYFYNWYLTEELWSKDPSVIIPVPAQILLKISDSRGCVREDNWKVLLSDQLKDLDILVPIEGLINRPIIAADISWPLPDSIIWTPEEISLSEYFITGNQMHAIYAVPGTYMIKADIYSGDCHVIKEKYCRVYGSKDSLTFPLPDNSSTVLQSIQLAPSPNTGTFKLFMNYLQLMSGDIFIYDSKGYNIYMREVNPAELYEIVEFDLTDAQPGIHALIYRAANGETRWINFLIIK